MSWCVQTFDWYCIYVNTHNRCYSFHGLCPHSVLCVCPVNVYTHGCRFIMEHAFTNSRYATLTLGFTNMVLHNNMPNSTIFDLGLVLQ
jgi:hypothetical protein